MVYLALLGEYSGQKACKPAPTSVGLQRRPFPRLHAKEWGATHTRTLARAIQMVNTDAERLSSNPIQGHYLPPLRARRLNPTRWRRLWLHAPQMSRPC